MYARQRALKVAAVAVEGTTGTAVCRAVSTGAQLRIDPCPWLLFAVCPARPSLGWCCCSRWGWPPPERRARSDGSQDCDSSAAEAPTPNQLVRQVALVDSDFTDGSDVPLIYRGNQVGRQVTLNYCGFNFTHREAPRRPPPDPDLPRTSPKVFLSNEVVAYETPHFAAKALRQLRKAANECPNDVFTPQNVTGAPDLRYDKSKVHTSATLPIADNTVVKLKVTIGDTSKHGWGVFIFQRHGTVLRRALPPDVQEAERGQDRGPAGAGRRHRQPPRRHLTPRLRSRHQPTVKVDQPPPFSSRSCTRWNVPIPARSNPEVDHAQVDADDCLARNSTIGHAVTTGRPPKYCMIDLVLSGRRVTGSRSSTASSTSSCPVSGRRSCRRKHPE